jgi:hypothetical protein
VEHPDRFYEELLASLELPYVGACWHLTDPETGLFTWTGHAGELPGDFISARSPATAPGSRSTRTR